MAVAVLEGGGQEGGRSCMGSSDSFSDEEGLERESPSCRLDGNSYVILGLMMSHPRDVGVGGVGVWLSACVACSVIFGLGRLWRWGARRGRNSRILYVKHFDD